MTFEEGKDYDPEDTWIYWAEQAAEHLRLIEGSWRRQQDERLLVEQVYTLGVPDES